MTDSTLVVAAKTDSGTNATVEFCKFDNNAFKDRVKVFVEFSAQTLIGMDYTPIKCQISPTILQVYDTTYYNTPLLTTEYENC